MKNSDRLTDIQTAGQKGSLTVRIDIPTERQTDRERFEMTMIWTLTECNFNFSFTLMSGIQC